MKTQKQKLLERMEKHNCKESSDQVPDYIKNSRNFHKKNEDTLNVMSFIVIIGFSLGFFIPLVGLLTLIIAGCMYFFGTEEVSDDEIQREST